MGSDRRLHATRKGPAGAAFRPGVGLTKHRLQPSLGGHLKRCRGFVGGGVAIIHTHKQIRETTP